MNLNEFKQKIESAWAETPATVKIQKINEVKDAPESSKCGRYTIYIGIIRGETADTMVVVKRSSSSCFTLSKHVEEVSDTVLHMCGVYPSRKFSDMRCRKCRNFSTYLNHKGLCHDCTKETFRNTASYSFGILANGKTIR